MIEEKMNLEEIFEAANRRFLRNNVQLFELMVSERTLCGALMLELHKVIKETEFAAYFVDVEFNKSNNGIVKKMLPGNVEKPVPINCDLIVHGRGTNTPHENLIAVEMKKSNVKRVYKENDKIRLMALTEMPENGVWSYDGKVDPETVCGYLLGIYYEINFQRQIILIEYYRLGNKYNEYIIDFMGNRI